MTLVDLVTSALKEDIPNGDMTTDPLEATSIKGKARLLAKQDLILSGTEPFSLAFDLVDKNTILHWYFKDGNKVSKGSEVCKITGALPSLLKSERTALNFLGHLTGVATLTSKFVSETQGTKTKILDTRKTLPLLRSLEKAAVIHGGGQNHRMGLSDSILIKENHIRTVGGISQAVKRIRKKFQSPIEIEVTSLKETKEALDCGVERLLLDNMTLQEMEEAIKIINGTALIEASGNMTLDRIKSVAKLGVDFISVGSLTHSAPCADLSLLVEAI